MHADQEPQSKKQGKTAQKKSRERTKSNKIIDNREDNIVQRKLQASANQFSSSLDLPLNQSHVVQKKGKAPNQEGVIQRLIDNHADLNHFVNMRFYPQLIQKEADLEHFKAFLVRNGSTEHFDVPGEEGRGLNNNWSLEYVLDKIGIAVENPRELMAIPEVAAEEEEDEQPPQVIEHQMELINEEAAPQEDKALVAAKQEFKAQIDRYEALVDNYWDGLRISFKTFIDVLKKQPPEAFHEGQLASIAHPGQLIYDSEVIYDDMIKYAGFLRRLKKRYNGKNAEVMAHDINDCKEKLDTLSKRYLEWKSFHAKEFFYTVPNHGLLGTYLYALVRGDQAAVNQSKNIVYKNNINVGDITARMSANMITSLQTGQLQARHMAKLPTKSKPGHQHIAKGSGGISFYYLTDGTPVIYDYAVKRTSNQYHWIASGEVTGGESSKIA